MIFNFEFFAVLIGLCLGFGQYFDNHHNPVDKNMRNILRKSKNFNYLYIKNVGQTFIKSFDYIYANSSKNTLISYNIWVSIFIFWGALLLITIIDYSYGWGAKFTDSSMIYVRSNGVVPIEYPLFVSTRAVLLQSILFGTMLASVSIICGSLGFKESMPRFNYLFDQLILIVRTKRKIINGSYNENKIVKIPTFNCLNNLVIFANHVTKIITGPYYESKIGQNSLLKCFFMSTFVAILTGFAFMAIGIINAPINVLIFNSPLFQDDNLPSPFLIYQYYMISLNLDYLTICYFLFHVFVPSLYLCIVFFILNKLRSSFKTSLVIFILGSSVIFTLICVVQKWVHDLTSPFIFHIGYVAYFDILRYFSYEMSISIFFLSLYLYVVFYILEKYKSFFKISPLIVMLSSFFAIALFSAYKKDLIFPFLIDSHRFFYEFVPLLFLNIFTDSFSILETRYVLRRALSGSSKKLVLFLFLDFLASSIIYLIVPLFSGNLNLFLSSIFFKGEIAWAGVFYWSSLFTSLFFYLYFLGFFSLHVLYKFSSIKYLAERPSHSLGFILATFVTIVYLLSIGWEFIISNTVFIGCLMLLTLFLIRIFKKASV